MKNMKRILSVKVKRMFDDSPDASTLGEYSNTPDTEFAIDRAHSEDCASVTKDVPNELTHNIDIAYARECDGTCSDCGAVPDDCFRAPCQYYNWEDSCDCGGHKVSSREYRYFNPATVEPFKPDAEWIPASIADASERKAYWYEAMRKNARMDYERMEGLNNQNWYYMGICAEAEIVLSPFGEDTTYRRSYTQTITSGGLWGVESDSDASYIKEIEQEQLSELKAQLAALGFSKRAISTAFKIVQEVSE